MYKLSEITKIIDIQSIPEADRIEKAKVLSWDVVVRKGLYSPGDLVCFIYPDTLIPKKFIDSTYEGEEKVRLKTVKMKGQYSAGLILPLEEVKKYVQVFKEGEDVATYLNIEKYEKPLSPQLAGTAVGPFPTFLVPKTDEDNYRSNPEAVQEMLSLGEEEIYITLKLDGSSATFFSKEDGGIGVCSRNLELRKEDKNSFWQMAEKYHIEEILKQWYQKHKTHLAIQGEVFGPGIQGNPMGASSLSFAVFLIKDITNNRWFTWEETVHFCKNTNYLVPVKEIKRMMAKDLNFEDLQKLADSLQYSNGKPAEGIVVRPVRPLPSKTLQKSWLSLKVMSQPYDLKN